MLQVQLQLVHVIRWFLLAEITLGQQVGFTQIRLFLLTCVIRLLPST